MTVVPLIVINISFGVGSYLNLKLVCMWNISISIKLRSFFLLTILTTYFFWKFCASAHTHGVSTLGQSFRSCLLFTQTWWFRTSYRNLGFRFTILILCELNRYVTDIWKRWVSNNYYISVEWMMNLVTMRLLSVMFCWIPLTTMASVLNKFSISHKPTHNDIIIHNTSLHPSQLKLAAYYSMIHRLR